MLKHLRPLLLASALITTACEPAQPQTPAADMKLSGKSTPDLAPPASTPVQTPKAKLTATQELVRKLDASIALYTKRTNQPKRAWLDSQLLAETLMARAKLTGSLDDYVAAGKALDQSFKDAPESAGPWMTLASYQFTVHEFDKAAQTLKHASTPTLAIAKDQDAIDSLHADIMFQRGQLKDALKIYERIAKASPKSSNLARLGHYHLKTGDLDGARKHYDRAIALTKTEAAALMPKAWTLLMRGIVELEAGQYDQAQAFFKRADETMPGWYLVEEHLAEVLKLQSKHDEAIVLYKRVLEKNPAGEFMDAMAECLRLQGKGDEAKTWSDKAQEAYKADIAKLPSAAYGHALDHFLEGDDKEYALTLARKNHELRPGPEPKLKLATALLNLDRIDEATTLLKEVSQTPYRTVDYHLVMAALYTHKKQEKQAKQQQQLAQKLNPHALD